MQEETKQKWDKLSLGSFSVYVLTMIFCRMKILINTRKNIKTLFAHHENS